MKNKKLLFTSIFLFALGLMFINSTKAANLATTLKGRILLQVERNGEAWYINPADEKRYFMGRPSDAFNLMRNLGIGIKNSDLSKIQIADANLLSGPDSDNDGLSDIIEDSFGTDKYKIDTDSDGYNDKTEILNDYNPLSSGKSNINNNFSKKQAGKILLQVEKNGEAWYIFAGDNKRYFLGKPADAFNIMRNLGLGITDNNLKLIDSNDKEEHGESVKDCKDDFNCFISASETCTPSKVNYKISTDIVGVIQETESSYKLYKSDAGKCAFNLGINNINITYSEELLKTLKDNGSTQEQIDQQLQQIKDQYKQLIDKEGSCVGDSAVISSMFKRWGQGILSTFDWDNLECNGPYFDQMYNSTNTENNSEGKCIFLDDCTEGFHCMNKECVSNSILNNFQNCSFGENECTQTCSNCKGGYFCMNSSESFKNNRCVECFMDWQCNSGYTCKSYQCIKE